MTGLFGRLRAWLSGGSGSESGGDETTAASDESAQRVVHRDDRPLETPQTLERPTPPASASTPDAEPGDGDRERQTPESVEIPDAENGTGTGSDSNPGRVSIPDAETPAGDAVNGEATDDHTPTGEASMPAESAPSSAPEPAESSDSAQSTDAETPDADDDEGFACSVCGTAVDDPDTSCPLCRSTDVVPVSDAPTEGDGPSREGRTAVSTSDDDEAVDRLRDVRDAGE